jgi:hypothetical protein
VPRGAAAYVRTLLEEDQEDLMEAAGVVKIPCDNCGYVALFDSEILGIRGLWAEGRISLQLPCGLRQSLDPKTVSGRSCIGT